MRVAIYTAIFGGYDELKPPVRQDIDCDFLCFTDRRVSRRFDAWRIIPVRRSRAVHPRIQAKWFKLVNHAVFPDCQLRSCFALRTGQPFKRPKYDATIWVDGSLQIRGSMMAREIASLVRDGSVAVFRHPHRDCIYEEAGASAPMRKYAGSPLVEQVEYYRSAGTPPHSGLFACGVIGRKLPSCPNQIAFDDAWWRENLRWTCQDQLSFAYLAHQYKMPVTIIPGNLLNNHYFDWAGHNSNA